MKKIIMVLMLLVLALSMTGCQKDDDKRSTVTSANAVVTDALSKIKSNFITHISIEEGIKKVGDKWVITKIIDEETYNMYYSYSIVGNKFVGIFEQYIDSTYCTGSKATYTINEDGSINLVSEVYDETSNSFKVLSTTDYSSIDKLIEAVNSEK